MILDVVLPRLIEKIKDLVIRAHADPAYVAAIEKISAMDPRGTSTPSHDDLSTSHPEITTDGNSQVNIEIINEYLTNEGECALVSAHIAQNELLNSNISVSLDFIDNGSTLIENDDMAATIDTEIADAGNNASALYTNADLGAADDISDHNSVGNASAH